MAQGRATTARRTTSRGAADCPPAVVGRDLAAGLLIGALTGFFGVGGGFLIVPTLAIALALSMRLAVGTSLAIITVTSVMGLGAHLARGPRHRRGRHRGDDRRVRGRRADRRHVRRPHPPATASAAASPLLVTAIAVYLLISAAFLGGPPTGS